MDVSAVHHLPPAGSPLPAIVYAVKVLSPAPPFRTLKDRMGNVESVFEKLSATWNNIIIFVWGFFFKLK